MAFALALLKKFWPAILAFGLLLLLLAWHLHAVEREGARRYALGVSDQRAVQAKADNKALSDAIAKSILLAKQAEKAANETAAVRSSYAAFASGASERERGLRNQLATALRQRLPGTAASPDSGNVAETVAGLLSRYDGLAERAARLGEVCSREIAERDEWIRQLTTSSLLVPRS